MEQTTIFLGKAQLPASRVGLGTWAIGGGWGPQPEAQSLEAIQEALTCGCSLIDTAYVYGNGRAERLVAQALQQHNKPVTIVTKVYPLAYQWAPAPGTPLEQVFSPEHIIAQAEENLIQLQTDCLDCLLLQTWCPSWDKDLSWYHTMLWLQQQGKIRSYGISVSDHRPDEANGVIEAGLVDILEIPFSILDQRAKEKLFPLAQQYHVSLLARSPLASGALAEHWGEGQNFHRKDWRRRVFRGELLEQTLKRVEMLKAVAGPTPSLAQFALRFCLSHPAIAAVIPGVKEKSHVHGHFSDAVQEPLAPHVLDQIAQLWEQEFRFRVRTSIGEEGEGERRIA